MKTKEELLKELGKDFDHIVDMSEFIGEGNWFQAFMTKELFEELQIPCMIECCGYGSGETEEEALIDLINSIKEYKKSPEI